jgi:hypothetical protein
VEQISGNDHFNHTATETYSVVAEDPESDTLIYLWIIADHSNPMFTLYWGWGDGNGNLTINWETDVGAQSGHSYNVYVSINDGHNDPVYSDMVQMFCTS